jgi:hypothetical protein
MARRGDVGAKIDGLGKFRRDLRAIDSDLEKELKDNLRKRVMEARDKARSNLRSRSKDPQNRIEKTIKGSLTMRGGSLYSDHPGSAVNEHGGTISPRGTPIEIRGKSYMYDAAEEGAKAVVEELDRSFDQIAGHHGFN